MITIKYFLKIMTKIYKKIKLLYQMKPHTNHFSLLKSIFLDKKIQKEHKHLNKN